MSIEQVQTEDKKALSVKMTPLEKHNSVEVGEVSDISEEDIGTHIQFTEPVQPSDEISRYRGRIHRGAIQTTSKEDRPIPVTSHVAMLWYSADR